MVLDAAFKIHSHFGPGLLESVYEACLAQELRDKDLKVETQVPVPVFFNGTKLEVGYHIDLLVEDMVVVEIKSVEVLAPVIAIIGAAVSDRTMPLVAVLFVFVAFGAAVGDGDASKANAAEAFTVLAVGSTSLVYSRIGAGVSVGSQAFTNAIRRANPRWY